jgi:hypothetical protein
MPTRHHRLHTGGAAAPADSQARHRHRAHQDQRYSRDATPARLLQGGDCAVGRCRGRGFVPALAPGWLDHFIYDEHYKTHEEFVYALDDAMSDKYRAIVEAGFLLQIDDPGIATSWDMIRPSRASPITGNT